MDLFYFEALIIFGTIFFSSAFIYIKYEKKMAKRKWEKERASFFAAAPHKHFDEKDSYSFSISKR